MTTRFLLTVLLLPIVVGRLQDDSVLAADVTQAAAVEAQDDAADIQPGTKCLLTAELECEIKRVTADEVLVYVTACGEAEQGVPMLSKVPYVNRLYKNVGVARTETRVVLSIPRERIEQITSADEDSAARQRHLQEAMEHLRAAGLDTLAGTVARQANQAANPPRAAEEQREDMALPRPVAGTRTNVEQQGKQAASAADGTPPQVLVALKVFEVSLTKLRESGSDIDLAGLGALLRPTSSADQPRQDQLQWAVLDCRAAKVLKAISRLQEAGLVKILAEPTLVTVSGRPATFFSGGEFPVPIPQSTGQVGVEYREYGTRVDVVAQHIGNGKRLRLEIRPVISEIDHSRSVNLGGREVPGLRVRTVDTATELASGQTLAIAGLVQEATSVAGSKRQSGEIALVVLVTPTLIDKTPDLAGETGTTIAR